LEVFPFLTNSENIPDLESQPPPAPPPRMETYSGPGADLRYYIAGQWEHDAQGCLETNMQNTPYYPFVMREVYKYIQLGMKKKRIETYYDNLMKAENTRLHFSSFKNGHCVRKLVATLQANQALREWDLHTLEELRWNDKHQCLVKSWSQDIMKRMRWLMR
jgi:hypothetical protein